MYTKADKQVDKQIIIEQQYQVHMINQTCTAGARQSGGFMIRGGGSRIGVGGGYDVLFETHQTERDHVK